MKIKTITPLRMQEIDRLAHEKYGIPSVVLMENAGRAVAEEIIRILKNSKNRSVVCVCGKGNNGGDGFVAARHLVNQGIRVSVFLAVSPELLSGDARINYEILIKMKQKVCLLSTDKETLDFKKKLKEAGLIVDALFGIGFKGQLQEPWKGIIELMNRSGRSVLSVDVPSGLDALTGRAAFGCIRASWTVTLAAPKTGLVKKDGRRFTGRLLIKDISIPRILLG